MPKVFSEKEKIEIKGNLIKEGERILREEGIKKVRIEDLSKSVGIGKGSFYLFYESKEDLFLDIINSFSVEIENEYLGRLEALDENKIVTSLTEVFTFIALSFYKSGIFRFLDKEEIKALKGDISKFDAFSLFPLKRNLLEDLFSYFYIENEEDIKSFVGAYKAILYLFLKVDDIDNLEERIKFLIRGIVLQLVE